MLLQAYKIHTSFVVLRLQAAIWIKNGLISISNLTSDAGNYIFHTYQNVETDKPLVIDCKGVLNVIDHSWDSLFKQIGILKRSVIFINAKSIEEKIRNNYKEYCEQSECHLNLASSMVVIYHRVQPSLTNILRDVEIIYNQYIKSIVLGCFCHHKEGKKLLKSTPILADGEYNANKIIHQPNSFLWTSIALYDYVEKIIDSEKIGKELPVRLLSVSLRSSPFAAVISVLLDIPLVTIEFFGPSRRSLDEQKYLKGGKFEFIYIGDFTFGGTEIRMSQMFSFYNNSKLEHAVVFGSLLKPITFPDFKLHPMFDLKELNPSVEYSLFL
jgi:hypothetical protein